MTKTKVCINPISSDDRKWIPAFITSRWGSERVIVHDTIYYPADLPGFVAREGDEIMGLVTFVIESAACEIVSLDSLLRGRGTGTALIDAVKDAAIRQNCDRLWLITTNDNLDALRFYQRRGFQISAVFPNALARSRAIKPTIPLIGEYGIPIRDEIELELSL